MQSFFVWWQHIPETLSPVAFSIGGWPIYWYALFFLSGAWLTYRLAGVRYRERQIFATGQYQDFAFGIFISALLGGKLGFLLLYWWPFLHSSNTALWPGRESEGLASPGMSFVGGLLAVTLFIYWYSRRHQKHVFTLTDVLAPCIPLAIFFGRLGSFVHNELIGRVTTHPWGMYVPGEAVLRHPSTLYAALLEGVVLFGILFFLRKQKVYKEVGDGMITAWFCIGYGVLRFSTEFFREPDTQIGYIGMFTFNQLLALCILALGGVLLTVKNRKNKVY